MFLSKLTLNTRNLKVRRDVADCYQLHRTILSAFEDIRDKISGARKTLNVLYRLSNYNQMNIYTLLVQSSSKPDWTRLPENYCANNTIKHRSSSCIEIKDISALLNAFEEGMELRFRLLANPTKKIGSTTKEERLAGKKKVSGKRVPLTAEYEKISWLKRKGEHHGFSIKALKLDKSVPNLTTKKQVKYTGYKKIYEQKQAEGQKSKRYRKIDFQGVLYEGILQITNTDDFKSGIVNGIGPGKAFGFGLLSVAHIN